jgi:hypothetical protein
VSSDIAFVSTVLVLRSWYDLEIVKTLLVCVALLPLTTLSAQRKDESRPNGVIHGIAVDQDGQPAVRIGLTAMPLGVALGTMLPHTKTNNVGEHRFDNVPWWGKYTVYADDEDAGYSAFSTGLGRDSSHREIEITPEHPEVEMRVVIPPKAGFIQIHLTNRRTGADISGMWIALMSEKSPASPVETTSCYSNHVILVPPDTSLLLHVNSDGFREWNESTGKGKPIRLASGTRLKLDVRLDPAE